MCVWVLTKGDLVSVNFADRTILRLYGLTTCKYAPIAFGFTTLYGVPRVRACTRYGPVTKTNFHRCGIQES